jgi:hypothetical protein
MPTNFQLIEINSWDSVPVDKAVRVYFGTLDETRKRFAELYGYECRVAYRLREQWLLVVDKDYKVEVVQ